METERSGVEGRCKVVFHHEEHEVLEAFLFFLPVLHGEVNIRLDLKGWERIESLRKNRKISKQVFIAMSFDKSLDVIYTIGIKETLKDLDYKPIRVDEKEDNNKIDDLILAEIRKSCLMIADFTGHRGGVYFEAGFALGLDIPVIFTCKEDDIKGAHFDTRQYNHILWRNETDLKEKLKNRIEATIL